MAAKRYATEGNVRTLVTLIKDKFEDYLTDEEISSAINDAVSSIASISFEKVDKLPETGQPNVIYLVPNSGSNPNVYDEYFWSAADSQFELFGTTALDLSGYVTTDALEAKNYVTNTELIQKDYVTNTELTAKDYVSNTELEEKDYVSNTELEAKKYVTESALAAKNYVDNDTLESKGYLTDDDFEAISDTEITQMWNTIFGIEE